ncbi:MAG: GTPase [Anaerolineales bacterium]
MSKRGGSLTLFASKWEGDIRRAWDSLPAHRQAELRRALELLPPNLKGWRRLIGHAVEHLLVATGERQRVAIVGPANVGKSTLYNQFVRAREDRAEVAAVAGTTREAQSGSAGLFSVVDTPGADAAGPVGEAEKRKALDAATGADVLVLLLDGHSGIGEPERQLHAELASLGRPTVIALNKMDLVAREAPAVIVQAARALGVAPEHILPLSAREGRGIEKVLLAIAQSEPRIVAALAAALPEYRWRLTQAVVGRAGSTAAAIAVTPWPFLSFFPLITVQSAMVLSIARIYSYRISLHRVRELLATFGLGLLGRAVFYEIAKLGGPPGWLVAAGVAAGTTVAMGYAAATWFERGERLPGKAVARITRTIGLSIVESLRNFGRKPPTQVDLRQKVHDALRDLPPPGDAAFLTGETAQAPGPG